MFNLIQRGCNKLDVIDLSFACTRGRTQSISDILKSIGLADPSLQVLAQLCKLVSEKLSALNLPGTKGVIYFLPQLLPELPDDENRARLISDLHRLPELLGLYAVPKSPTIYISARAEYDGNVSTLYVRGATNLPYKSLLTIYVYDFVGTGSTTLSVEGTAQVSRDGFFESTVKAAPGRKFFHNMACDVTFMPKYPRQLGSVLAVTGSEGEYLGFPRNPQVEQHSGEYYLTDLIHVP